MSFAEQVQENKNPAVKIIADYLMARDDLKEKLENPKKSLKEMFDYIMSEAKKQANSGCACLSDDVVFGMAVHYYDEDKIEFKKVSGTATVTSSPSSKNDDKDKEIKKLQEKIKKLEKKEETKEAKPKKKKESVSDIEMEQISLF